jgi:hypothetical protein
MLLEQIRNKLAAASAADDAELDFRACGRRLLLRENRRGGGGEAGGARYGDKFPARKRTGHRFTHLFHTSILSLFVARAPRPFIPSMGATPMLQISPSQKS